MRRNFLKRLKSNKIRVRFVIRWLEALIDRSCDRRVNVLGFWLSLLDRYTILKLNRDRYLI